MNDEKKKILLLIKKYERKKCSSKKQSRAKNKKLRKMFNSLSSLYNHQSSSNSILDESQQSLTHLELKILRETFNKSQEKLKEIQFENEGLQKSLKIMQESECKIKYELQKERKALKEKIEEKESMKEKHNISRNKKNIDSPYIDLNFEENKKVKKLNDQLRSLRAKNRHLSSELLLQQTKSKTFRQTKKEEPKKTVKIEFSKKERKNSKRKHKKVIYKRHFNNY